MPLTLDPNWQDGDAFYEALIAAHDGLSADESHAFNARLILTLANHIGDTEVLAQALEVAQAPD
jgi:hypothetical protein